MYTYNTFDFSTLLLKPESIVHSQFGLGFITLSENYVLQLVLKLNSLSIEIIKPYHFETQTVSN